MIFSKCTLVLLILISLFTTVNSYPAGDDASYHEVFEQLVNLKADPQKSADVSELVISRETGTFTLEEGKLFLCTQVNGTVCAAVFTGKGTFSYTPPDDIEKEQLERFYEKRELTKNFEVLFLMFADSTLSELESKLDFHPGQGADEADKQIFWSLKFLSDESAEYFNPDLILKKANYFFVLR